jgi:hypothetical protein
MMEILLRDENKTLDKIKTAFTFFGLYCLNSQEKREAEKYLLGIFSFVCLQGSI